MVLIAGPTASGKSALALALAQLADGVVINADSAQLYRDIPILSAAPTADQRACADHRLYGFRDGAHPCSAAEWAAMARAEVADAHSKGRLPILVGGTGLYIRTLLEGIAPVPRIDRHVRERVRAQSIGQNRAELQEVDANAAARLHPADTSRIARALEVVLSTGRTLADWQRKREGGIGDTVDLRPIVLLPPRDWLYKRCNERFAEMVGDGAIEEARALLARALNPSLPVMRAIGLREIAACLAGEIGREEMIARGQQSTRNYAKRQYTWFKHQPPAAWPRFDRPLDDEAIEDALALLGASA